MTISAIVVNTDWIWHQRFWDIETPYNTVGSAYFLYEKSLEEEEFPKKKQIGFVYDDNRKNS